MKISMTRTVGCISNSMTVQTFGVAHELGAFAILLKTYCEATPHDLTS